MVNPELYPVLTLKAPVIMSVVNPVPTFIPPNVVELAVGKVYVLPPPPEGAVHVGIPFALAVKTVPAAPSTFG